ncbi:MAG: hypothetical protein AB1757_11325 [Acidobacteriota bacterium]
MQKRSFIFSLIVITVVLVIGLVVVRRDAIFATQANASSNPTIVSTKNATAGEQTNYLRDDSAEVSATLPFFHRLDANYTRGAEPAHGGIETIKRLGIKTIVDLRSIYDHTDELGIAAERSGLQYRWLPTSVWNPPTDKEAKAFVALVSDKTQGPFYVFCADGVNRSGEMSAIYRIAESKWSVAQALKEADDFGFNPYYYNLRTYVYTFARKFHPKALPLQARSLSSLEM